uniref:site-specific DNA-methyltransferase n=1 Tax=Cyanobium sp. TaxID=2164130 RepID=UPI004047195E
MHFSCTSTEIVDLCYIDPPYNTGSKFLYHDSRKSSSSGPFGTHSEWMAFMLPRLFAAREILKRTGVIAVSIDDYEHVYLKVLMDHIFGEDNFIGNIVVCRSKNGKGGKKNIAPSHEYLLVYGKSSESELLGLPDDDNSYNKVDDHGKYKVDGLFRKKGEASLRSDRPNMYYPIYFKGETGQVFLDPAPGLLEVFPVDSKGVERRWLWGLDTARKRSWQLFASRKGIVYVKNYAGIDREKRTKVRTLWDETAFYTERATNEITNLFGAKIFDTPKPLEYIKTILNCMANRDALIMDFFAGSGTTAHAAMSLNVADRGTRKTILMEDSTPIKHGHIAYEEGFRVTSDITVARLEKLRKHFPDFTFNNYSLVKQQK